MRLITPKRLKENEAFMWQLADQQLDTFLAPGEGEFISGFAGPFTLLVIADLLGVPHEDRAQFADRLQHPTPSDGGLGSTGDDTMAHSPLEYLYEQFRLYVADRRREPRDDVLTEMATATFPDGSTPEVIEVVRVAANLFAAGQETTVRLLERGAQGDRRGPRAPAVVAERTRAHPQLHRGDVADGEPGQGRLPAVSGSDDGGWRRPPGGNDGDGVERCREP